MSGTGTNLILGFIHIQAYVTSKSNSLTITFFRHVIPCTLEAENFSETLLAVYLLQGVMSQIAVICSHNREDLKSAKLPFPP
jgi:hypothetical protein